MGVLHTDLFSTLIHQLRKFVKTASNRYCSDICSIISRLQQHPVDQPFNSHNVAVEQSH
ncbi:hypothetical protein SDC9_141375 [bioreactor metagenome]|uniref:Uncharacterized protein n=1 Tax=bioreactor metagenome TaxID=1076179 RepID=A0A645DXI9_9ZZZZ